MKSLLLYFIEFYKEGTIVPKKYPDDYVVEGSNQRLFIVITHDKSTFSANNGYKKI